MQPSLRQDLDTAVAAAQQGSEIIKRWTGNLQGADYKGEVDPVTQADRQAEAAIIRVIGNAYPGDAVLAEESGGDPLGNRRVWIIDPLDGTVNFLHGVPHVGVSVALYEDGKPLVGVILDVFRDETYTAASGSGAFRNGAPIAVSTQDDLGAALVATGFPYDRRDYADTYGTILGTVLGKVQGIRRMGTASLDLAWVACGRYDGFWELKLAPWDVAAGILLVQEAGGKVTDQTGRPARPGDPLIIAANETLSDDLRPQVVAAVPRHLIE
jgi:myo-inositol-1(or 4)-monophosphatase